MNWDFIEADWKQYKEHVKAQWAKLTDDQLGLIAGKRDLLVSLIRELYGIESEEADRQIKSFQKFLWESSLLHY